MSINDSAEGEVAQFALEIPDSGQSPEDHYSQRERKRILFSAMKELPHATQWAMQLRELDERSTKRRLESWGFPLAR
jgi:DNA-directed RNA polymerase specialized sigma subunit